jgi:collagenase-like PrtC family protease
VSEVYGCSSATPVGTGRPSMVLGKVTKDDIPLYIQRVHEKGLRFNYVLNAPCMNNREYSVEGHKDLIEQIDWLASIGVDGFTVSIPYIIEIIKKRHPHLSVKASIAAHIGTARKAKNFENLGVDEIMIDNMINRDFKMLDKIRKTVNCKLSILLNDACLYDCPYRVYHYNTCGHSSQTKHEMNGFYIDYCSIRCTLDRLNNPSLLVSARFVRPEDIKYYEDIGFDSFKLSGRRMKPHWILRAAKAYSSRWYDGNLSDILDYSLIGVEEDVQSPDFEPVMRAAKDIKAPSFAKLATFMPHRPNIDNRALDGFMKQFIEQKCSGICNECNYCKSWAEKAVKTTQEERDIDFKFYNELMQDLITSKIYLD